MAGLCKIPYIAQIFVNRGKATYCFNKIHHLDVDLYWFNDPIEVLINCINNVIYCHDSYTRIIILTQLVYTVFCQFIFINIFLRKLHNSDTPIFLHFSINPSGQIKGLYGQWHKRAQPLITEHFSCCFQRVKNSQKVSVHQLIPCAVYKKLYGNTTMETRCRTCYKSYISEMLKHKFYLPSKWLT